MRESQGGMRSRENFLFSRKLETRLEKGGIASPRAEAEILISHFGEVSRLDFFTGEKTLRPKARTRIACALSARLNGQPLSYIVGEREFFGRRFFVDANTLIPRPETEILVEEAIKIIDQHFLAGNFFPEVLDLGTGSGCIAVSLTCERPDCRMTALEVSEEALRMARKNIRHHGLQKRIKLIKSDLFSAFRPQKLWDVVVSNPPYVPEEEMPGLPREVRREPRTALNGGSRGLKIIGRILDKAPVFLKEKGWLLIEVGAGQSKVLRSKIKTKKVFKNLSFVKDYAGIERVLIAQKN